MKILSYILGCPVGVASWRGAWLTLGKRYLAKPRRRNISPMLASDANSSVCGSGTRIMLAEPAL